MNFYERLLEEARRSAGFRLGARDAVMRRLGRDPKRPRKKPPEAGLPVPAVPPGGPLPKQGGAEAPLEFD